MRIEKAKQSDAKIIAEIGRQTFFESHSHCCEPKDFEIYLNESFSLSRVQSELGDPRNIFHLIYVDNDLAGYSKFIPNFKNATYNRDNVAKLERIYVLEKFFDKRIGSRLFKFLLNEAKEHHQVGMMLQVWVENHRAIEFYKRMGFKVVGETTFRLSPTRANPNHLMFLELHAKNPAFQLPSFG